MKIKCPGCSKVYMLKPELAGKTVKCSACQHKMRVPAAKATPPSKSVNTQPSGAIQKAATPSTSTPQPVTKRRVRKTATANSTQLTQSQILGAFKGDIAPVRVSLAYRFVTLIVSAVMLLLPLIYIGIIAGFAYGVYYHAVNNTGMLSIVRGRGAVLMFLLYASPILVGPIAILFMIKPLFTRLDRTERERWLNRDNEPLLFAFVDRICDAVHAPEPQRIRVDCDLNASASFRRGFLSMLTGNDLVLTLGMPLVSGMSMQQFAGVIAHEFGHFSQGTGMRLSFLIRYISHWFAKVVYQRDSWDMWLDEAASQLDFRIAWIFYLAKLMVWLTRWVLWGLMIIGNAFAGMLLRQMEYDADRHEARLAGSRGFVSGTRQLRKLSLAYQGMQSQMSEFYREGKLADNLPKLLRSTTRHMPKEAIAELQATEEQESTGLFDTHPCDHDRIENALRENAEGVFHLHQPASDLFRNFDAICKGTTQDFYRSIFGKRLKIKELKSTDELIKQQDATIAEARVVDIYFNENFSAHRGIRLGTGNLQPPANAKDELHLLQTAKNALNNRQNDYAKLLGKFEQLDTNKLQADLAITMHRAGTFSRRMPFTIPVSTLEEAKTTSRKNKKQLESIALKLVPFEKLASQRLNAALRLSLHPAVVKRIKTNRAVQKQTKGLVETLQCMNGMLTDYNAGRHTFRQLASLLDLLSGNEENEDYIGEVLSHTKTLHSKLTDMRTPLRNQDYPFDHARGQINLAEFIIGDYPPSDDVGAVANAGDQFTVAFSSVYRRIVGKLVVVANRVESALIR